MHRIAVHLEKLRLMKCGTQELNKKANKMIHGFELDTTAKNLTYAADGERYEHETMYPDFEAIAKEERHCAVARLLKLLAR